MNRNIHGDTMWFVGSIRKGTVLKCVTEEMWPEIKLGNLYVVAQTTPTYPTWVYVFTGDEKYINDYPIRLFDIIVEP